MRGFLCLVSVLIGCGKGDMKDEGKTTNPPVAARTSAMDAAVAATTGSDASAPVPTKKDPERSWSDLLERTSALEKGWSSRNEKERVSFYQQWTRSTRAISIALPEEADAEELEALYSQDPRPESLQFSAEEGYPYAARVSPAWLLKTFPDLPASEKEFLSWIDGADRDGWFAEGNLEVTVGDMTRSYKQGAALLSQHKDGFRASDIGEELDAIARDLSSLLSQPPAYAKKKYQRELRAAFSAMSKVERHAATARALISKFPAKGVPYPYEEVERLREELGLVK